MRSAGVYVAATLLLLGCGDDPLQGYQPQDGDIIFHTSSSRQSVAVQAATGSPYSHMGLVFLRDGDAEVLEAVGPVKTTPLAAWIARGEGDRFAVRRLAAGHGDRLAAAAARLKRGDHRFLGRPYDKYFDWTDDSLYCSELVWKIYAEELGIELAPLERFGDFDLEHPVVAQLVAERWGDDPPLEMEVISPATILDSPLLEPVVR